MIKDVALRISQVANKSETFIAIYDAYITRVYNYIHYRCDDGDTTEDLTAQVFEQLLKSYDRITDKGTPINAWIFTVARNLVNSYYRRRRIYSWLPWEVLQHQPNEDPGPEEIIMQHESESQLSEALRELSSRERDLLGLKFSSRLDNGQIAELIGISESNVGVILYRALHKLRKALCDSDWLERESSKSRDG